MSDILFIQFATGGGQYSRKSGTGYDDFNSVIELDKEFKVDKGDIVLISNGAGRDLFENVIDESLSSNSYVKKNSDISWSVVYGGNDSKNEIDRNNFELLVFKSLAYYVAEDPDNKNIHSLYRARFDYGFERVEQAELLVPGVEDMQLEYGIKNVQGEIYEYAKADEVSEWGDVIAIRIKLKIKAESGYAKDFSTVVTLRNLL